MIGLERYFHTKQYPLTHQDILCAYDRPPVSALYFGDKEKWETDIQNCRTSVLTSMHDEISTMLRWT